MEIDLKAFLDAAFGWIDAESGYGAAYPESRGMVNYFRGRLGHILPTSNIFPASGVLCDPFAKPARQLADDLEELARQIRERLPEPASPECNERKNDAQDG